MSQLEQQFRVFLSRHPEIGKAYHIGLINRRSLARHLIQQKVARSNQLEAVIAMLRRFNFEDFSGQRGGQNVFSNIRVTLKDDVLIFDFEKEKALLERLQQLIQHINYDTGDTFKVVIGSGVVKLFIDQGKAHVVDTLFNGFTLKHQPQKVSEISVMFPEKIIDSKGTLSTLTQELVVHDVIITELLTASPELLVYLDEKHVLKAYDVIKTLQKGK